jgi:hypothetical protein
MTEPVRLLDTPRHRMTWHGQPEGARTLVISFNPMKIGLADTGFASDFILRLGHEHVFVAEGAGSFYQHLTLADFAAALAPLAGRYDRVFLYGSSLGGYAALFYARAVEGTAVALSPRLPIHPYMARHMAKPVSTQPMLHPALASVADPAARPVVMFDPRDPADADFVATLVQPAHPAARLFPLPGAGHRVARILAYQRVLKPLMAEVFATGEVSAVPYDPANRPRRHLALAKEALAKGDLATAGKFLAKVAREPSTAGFAEARWAWEEASGHRMRVKTDAARKRPG